MFRLIRNSLLMFAAVFVINVPAFALDLDFGPEFNPQTIPVFEKNFSSDEKSSGVAQTMFTFMRVNNPDGTRFLDVFNVGGGIFQDVEEGSPSIDGKATLGIVGMPMGKGENPYYAGAGVNYQPVVVEHNWSWWIGVTKSY